MFRVFLPDGNGLERHSAREVYSLYQRRRVEGGWDYRLIAGDMESPRLAWVAADEAGIDELEAVVQDGSGYGFDREGNIVPDPEWETTTAA